MIFVDSCHATFNSLSEEELAFVLIFRAQRYGFLAIARIGRPHQLSRIFYHSYRRLQFLFSTLEVCSGLEFRTNHVKLYVGQDKHAIYPSIQVCDDLTMITYKGIKVWSEICGGGGSFFFNTFNVGEINTPNEPNHQLIDNLDSPDSWIDLTAT